MIPKSEDILKKFVGAIIDCQALFYHCISTTDKHTEAGVEAAFLQLVKSWESFLEDSTLILLCGEKPISGISINPKFVLSNIEDVRAIIYNGFSYTDWIKTESLNSKFKMFFDLDTNKENRLIIAIKQTKTTLNEIRLIRNEIAHSSLATEKQVQQIYRDFDPLKTFNRPAQYLKELSKKIPTKPNFILYSESLEVTAKQILG